MIAESPCVHGRSDQTPPYRTRLVQWTAHIGLCSIRVPASHIGTHTGLKFTGRAFTDHVHRGAIVALADNQTG
ncbi:hypothetical protein SDC9_200046 [bioreactor metagenome]|uniref:Uncharacterized protein n=1 Tax=bioreactor metagenome TaxID=1076179 RepID=A0A645IM35_9ZZZZ